MTEVHQLFNETVLDFVKRKGPIATTAIGYRFGMSAREVFKVLSALRRQGLIKSKRGYSEERSMNVWEAT